MVNSALDRRNAMRMADKTFGQNMKMAEYQYSKDLEMWNRGNLYNSPQAQMERLKSAGLNPNLVYGGGAVGNTTAQLPKYNAPTADYTHVPPIQLPNVISAYQDFAVKSAQINNLREQNRIASANADIRENFRNWEVGKDWFTSSSGKLGEPMELELISRGGRKRDLELQRLSQKAELEKSTMPYQQEMSKQSLNKKLRDIELNKLQQKRLEEDTKMIQQRNEYFLWNLFGNMLPKYAGQLLNLGKGSFNQRKR